MVRGAIEAGVQFVTTYPGTPASEIGNTFYKIQRERLIKDLYFEFSSNEKVALEVGAGASFSGLRVLVAMKHFGVNVASDFLFPLAYSG
ncbi:MAG TPA: indolepyruvate ferredoxin oxidoreductase subunit alpha, partial [Candidatus Latescibacteria bacterium]|nr:indolepyruvate ferredoxin oxidoreductase subunit alpha [Candidatus Latescibacterota bacterium]